MSELERLRQERARMVRDLRDARDARDLDRVVVIEDAMSINDDDIGFAEARERAAREVQA